MNKWEQLANEAIADAAEWKQRARIAEMDNLERHRQCGRLRAENVTLVRALRHVVVNADDPDNACADDFVDALDWVMLRDTLDSVQS